MKKLLVLALVLAYAGFASAAITDGLLAHVAYDEGTGITTHDSSGNGFDGTLFFQDNNKGSAGNNYVYTGSSAWTTAGKFGNALVGYGDGDAKIMDSHLLGDGKVNTNDTTFSFWVKRPDSRNIGWGSGWVTAWDMQDGAYSGTDETQIAWNNTSSLRYDHVHMRYDEWASSPYSGRNLNIGHSAGGAWDKNNIGYALGDDWGNGVWQNIIVTITGNPNANENPPFNQQRFVTKVYVNGALATQISESGWGWGSTPISAFQFGANQQMKGIDINDQVDDLGIWTRVLTSDEIAWIASGVAPIPEPATMTLLGLGALSLIRRKK